MNTIMCFKTPILLIVFNRPELTKLVYDSLCKIHPKYLYISCDAPRSHRDDDIRNVDLVREIVVNGELKDNTRLKLNECNYGCNLGPKTAIDWFFENEDYGIILEDDCVPSLSFFKFCEEMLQKYKDEARVMSITGNNINIKMLNKYDYGFSKYPLMWGWATWKRAWIKYDGSLTDWHDLRASKWLKSLKLGGILPEYTWKKIFDETKRLREKATWWDYQWIYTCWLHQGIVIFPKLNLVRNIGFSETATHTKWAHPILSNLVANELEFPINHPDILVVDNKYDKYVSKVWFGASYINYFKKLLLKIKIMQHINIYIKKTVFNHIANPAKKKIN